jgi:hypothetical protein
MKPNIKQIRAWMNANVRQYVDEDCNLVNMTLLVEAWDSECSTGISTLDNNHPAWDIVLDIAQKYEDRCKK